MERDEAARLRDLIEQRFGPGAADGMPLDEPGLATLLAIAGRGSTRRWAKREVPDGLVRLLAATALCAPTKSYLQQADIVHVRSPEQRAKLMALLPDWAWAREAPAFLVFCGNGSRFRQLFAGAGQPFVNDHLDAFFNSTVDASLVMMNFMTAAQAMGLATCPISVIRNRAGEVGKLLELPPLVFPVAGLALGYPDGAEPPKPRLRLDATLHVDTHGGANQLDDVQEFDRREAPDGSRAAWSQAKVNQYAEVQRDDWGSYVRGIGFDLR